MSLQPAVCPNCGAGIKIDATKEAGICEYCGTPFITEKAINNYITNIKNEYNIANATISMSGKTYRKVTFYNFFFSRFRDDEKFPVKSLMILLDDKPLRKIENIENVGLITSDFDMSVVTTTFELESDNHSIAFVYNDIKTQIYAIDHGEGDIVLGVTGLYSYDHNSLVMSIIKNDEDFDNFMKSVRNNQKRAINYRIEALQQNIKENDKIIEENNVELRENIYRKKLNILKLSGFAIAAFGLFLAFVLSLAERFNGYLIVAIISFILSAIAVVGSFDIYIKNLKKRLKTIKDLNSQIFLLNGDIEKNQTLINTYLEYAEKVKG